MPTAPKPGQQATLGQYIESLPQRAQLLIGDQTIGASDYKDFNPEQPILIDQGRHGAEIIFFLQDGGGTGENPAFRAYRRGIPGVVNTRRSENERASRMPDTPGEQPDTPRPPRKNSRMEVTESVTRADESEEDESADPEDHK
jgi:hypothetical protein